MQMLLELVMAVVMVSLDSCILDGAVHPFHLAVGPRMIDLGEAMLDAIFATAHGEHVRSEFGGRAICISGWQAKLNAVIGQNGMNFIGHGGNARDEKGRRRDAVCLLFQLDEGKFAGSVDGDEEIQLSLGGLHFGDIDVEEADRVALELLLGWLNAFDVGQPRDAMALQTAMQ